MAVQHEIGFVLLLSGMTGCISRVEQTTSDSTGETDESTGEGETDESAGGAETDETTGGDDGGTADGMLGAGGSHNCARSETGALRCWGYGQQGQLGYGNANSIGDDETPASAGDVDVGGAVVELALGFYHTCARLETGAVRCWGFGAFGQLGYGNTEWIGDDEVPALVGDVDLGGLAVDLAAGDLHTCARLETGAVRCWGWGTHGELGYANTESIGDDETPAAAGDVDVGGVVVELDAGGSRTCVRLESGTVRCWGEGHLGYENAVAIGDDETPASAGDIDVGGPVAEIATAHGHTCARLQGGNVRCWGYGSHGELGYGNTESIGDDETPASAGDVDVGGVVVELSAGTSHTCARLEAGGIRCWGIGSFGQLGYGNTEWIGDDETPASAGNVDVGGMVLELAAGDGHTCARLTSGAVRCWGWNFNGDLGYGHTNQIGDDESPASAGDVFVF